MGNQLETRPTDKTIQIINHIATNTYAKVVCCLIVGFIKENYIPNNIPVDIINIFYSYIGDCFKSDGGYKSLLQGEILLVHSRFGKPKFRVFEISPNSHTSLKYFNPKQSLQETQIKLKDIHKILFGVNSKITQKTKNKIIYQSSFTIYYKNKDMTLTAKSIAEAYMISNTLIDLSNLAKKGEKLQSINVFASFSDKLILRSIQSDFKIFKTFKNHKSAWKQQNKLNRWNQRLVNFVMELSNYKKIAKSGHFEKIKLKMIDIDNRLRNYKENNELHVNSTSLRAHDVDIDTLLLCWAELDALQSKLKALVSNTKI